MKTKIIIKCGISFIILLMFNSCSSEQYIVESKSGIEQVNKKIISGQEFYKRSYDNLIRSANSLLTTKFKSVLDKKIDSPSGIKNDYVSIAAYYWPKEGGKPNEPWIYIDGKLNREKLGETDHVNYHNVLDAVKRLSLAYYFSRNLKYANKTVKLIRLWFTDDSTKMNPHFDYAQGIPGKSDGTPSGIIDSRGVIWVIQALELIKEAGKWNINDNEEFKSWCKELLFWLSHSEFGHKESKNNNNHGSYYDLQVAFFSSYLGEDSLAMSIIEDSKQMRIDRQILPDGSQPNELKRASAFAYSIFNLSALINLALLGDQYNIDLWNYKGEESGSIKDALDFLIENSFVELNWRYSGQVHEENLLRLLYPAMDNYGEEYKKYIDMIEKDYKRIYLTDLYFVN